MTMNCTVEFDEISDSPKGHVENLHISGITQGLSEGWGTWGVAQGRQEPRDAKKGEIKTINISSHRLDVLYIINEAK